MTLFELINVPFEDRDLNWENNFFHKFTSLETKLKLLSPEPQAGPDGWPYLLVEISNEGDQESQKVIQWAATKGIGIAVNPQKEYPDYVFTFGMLWSFRETGFFYQNSGDIKNGMVELNTGSAFVYGEPSKKYLPEYAKNILKEFFRDQGLLNVKVLLFSQDKINYDMLFSIESLKNPPQKEHDGILEAISWFLPPHYSIALVSESSLPPFYDL